MQTFEEWLKATHPEALQEGWRDWGKKAAVGGALLGAGWGMGQMGSAPAPEQPAPAVQQQVQPGMQGYQDPTMSPAMQRWKARVQQHDRAMAQKHKGTPKEIQNTTWTAPNAGQFLNR